MYDVISFGSATFDVFAKTDSELITIKTVKSTEELIAYPSGSKILMKKLEFCVGGGGTNAGVCFSRLGLKSAYVGNIGNDDAGKKVVEALKKEGVDFLGSVSNDMTNYSIILDSIGEDRTILVYKDASEKLDFDNIDKDKLMSRWFYITALEVKLLEKLVKFASKKGIKVAFNPSNYLADKGSEYIKNVLKKTEMIILNDEEAKLLVGTGSIPILLDRLKKLGPNIVVLTQGSNGADVLYNDIIYHCDVKKVDVVETTGAGDAFGATFLSGMILKNSIEKALLMAIVNSSSVVTKIGPKNGLLKSIELEKSIGKSKLKISTLNLKQSV